MAIDSGTKEQSHKEHRSRQSGAKADKKKRDTSQNGKKQNPKAFAFSSTVKAKRLQSRSVEKEQRRLHVPTIDRSYGEQPPYVVLVHGPPKVYIVYLISAIAYLHLTQTAVNLFELIFFLFNSLLLISRLASLC